MKNVILYAFLICTLFQNNKVFSQVRDYWPTEEWQEKPAGDAGMKVAWLEQMQQTIESSMPFVDAFLIVKNGYLVFEKYYNNNHKDNYHILCSSTKSITGILTGIMLKQHYIDSIGEKIIDILPEYKDLNEDPRLSQLTIEHILTFTAGITNTDDNATSRQPNMISYYLSQPFYANPGAQFRYATPASQVLSAIISKKTGMNARDFAAGELFQKLGISYYYWPADQQGFTLGGYNAFLRPRDMLKLGFLYLNQGIWNGDTIVDPGFVAVSTIAHSNGGNPHKEKYGYNWWITVNNGYHAYFAGGYGGQFIYVVPDLDLVVAITCRTDRHREDARFLINNYVVPAILNLSSINKQKIEHEPELTIFPNPSKGEVNLSLDLKEMASISLKITELSGRIVYTVFERIIFQPGHHNYKFTPNLPSGCYILKYDFGFKESGNLLCIL